MNNSEAPFRKLRNMKKMILLLIIAGFFLQISFYCEAQEKPYYILFENKVDGMFKKAESNSDSSFYYTINLNRAYWKGFQPTGDSQIISTQDFYNKHRNELKDIEWLRYLVETRQDPLYRKKNIYIVEKLSQDSVRLTKTKYFVEIE